MTRNKLSVIVRTDDPYAYFMGIYKTVVGGCITTWSSDIIDAHRFESMAAARRFIASRMPKIVSPYCRVRALPIVDKQYSL